MGRCHEFGMLLDQLTDSWLGQRVVVFLKTLKNFGLMWCQ